MTVQELKNLVNSIPDSQNNKKVGFEYSMFVFGSVDKIYNTKREIKQSYKSEYECIDDFDDTLGSYSVLISFGN